MWDEWNFVVIWAFFSIALLWDWNENWPFPILWPLLSIPNLLAYWVIECRTLKASSFKVWGSSTGIPSLLLALLVVMLTKAHLTPHSRISVSKCVIKPLGLSGSLRSFLYSSLYSCQKVQVIINKNTLNVPKLRRKEIWFPGGMDV